MSPAKRLLFPLGIPEQIADLNTKKNYLAINASRFGIPAADMTRIDTQVNAAIAAHTKASDRDTRTKLDVANRILAIKTAQKTIRKIIAYYVVDNPNATIVDYEALNIPRPGPYPHLPPPKQAPGIGHITSEYLSVTIPFFDAQTRKLAKPEGVQAIEAYYKLGGDPPKGISEMIKLKNSTASPMHVQFEPDKELEILYLVFRWIGTRGDFGPWSEIYKIVISR
jgi:hypothetical protein